MVVLISEGWPSLLAMLGKFCEETFVEAENLEEKYRKVFDGRLTWGSSFQSDNLVRDQNSLVLLQGSLTFVKHRLQQWGHQNFGNRLVVLLPQVRLRGRHSLLNLGLSWHRIHHAALGGLTSSVWTLGLPWPTSSDIKLDTTGASSGLVRKFTDVVSVSENGKICNFPSEPLPEIINWKNHDLDEEMVLPSVFSRTSWVRRKLTMKEIGAVFDVPELKCKVLEALVGISQAIPFVSAPPGKVAELVKDLLLEKFGVASSAIVPVSTSSNLGKRKVEVLMAAPTNVQNVDDAGAYLLAYGDKAAKNDDAAIPVELWNSFLFRKFLPHLSYDSSTHGRALSVLRQQFGLAVYKRNIYLSFKRYLKRTYGAEWWSLLAVRGEGGKKRKRNNKRLEMAQELRLDLEVGMDAIERVLNGSWWEWDNGSTLFFWRWPEFIRKQARDGVRVFIQGKLPDYRKRQRLPTEPGMAEKMYAKMKKVIARRYLVSDFVKSVINCFSVPKGIGDIRLVYDGTKSGLNEACWAPNFFVPSVDTMLMPAMPYTWYGDRDLGEQFLNYFMDKRIRLYSGVDVTEIIGAKKREWRRWDRTFMWKVTSESVR